MDNKTFLGTGWAFPPEFSTSLNQNVLVSDDEDIHQSLMILLSTKPGERVMQPDYGCGVHRYVFENYDESLAAIIKEEIRLAILFFETRILIENIDFDTENKEEGLLRIFINYRIKATNDRSNMVYPFYFLEGTNISDK